MEYKERHSHGLIPGLQIDLSVFVVDGKASSFVKVTLGVPQGAFLGPLMFLLFINNIRENKDSSLRLFADDALLYRITDSTNDCAILQNDIEKLTSWAETWQMQFNVIKCHKVRLSRKKVISLTV